MILLKKVIRLIRLVLITILALAGGFVMLAPRRTEQDYDNEIATELVEGKKDQIEETEKT